MTAYRVERDIDAPPDAVWALLTDASRFTEWNATVIGIEGSIRPGQRIRLTSTLNPKRTFTMTVSGFEPPRHMVWSDGMPLGLFKGERTYTIAKTGSGVSHFVMEEVFSGPMEPLISRSIPDMTENFAQFADSLKAAAEAGS